MSLLAVRGLGVAYARGPVLSELGFEIGASECLGLVGESGSGKSQAALAIIGLLPPSAQVCGQIWFEGRELLALPERERRRLRGLRIGMVFQDPMSSLNPYLRIGEQIAELRQQHQGASRADSLAEAARLLDAVRVGEPARRLRQYPHELSGGLRQRVMIAMMLSLRPALLIADEPTTALDATVQAQVLRLLAALRRDFGLSLLMISHDLGVIAELADRVLVLYGGRAMEQGGTDALLSRPRHPYTQALIASRPRLDGARPGQLPAIPGSIGSARECHSGCVFAPRCASAQPVCRQHAPEWSSPAPDRSLACHHPLHGAALR